jgi:methylenetetrahydrofolate dehydrogenase (NADP+)/methenyltetrahydrofolate cyclohydrolase
MILLDGRRAARALEVTLAERALMVLRARGRAPGLGVILVGDDPASAVYVRNKERAAARAGIVSTTVRLAATASEADVLAAVFDLNVDDCVDAFIVQLPLPAGIDAAGVLGAVLPGKDADGLHPENLGRLLCGEAAPVACTAAGVLHLLDCGGVPLAGKRALVLGRSRVVGKPVALLLLARDATVTLCHSQSTCIADEVGRADVVIAAVGRPGFVRGEWIRPGAAVVDVGINRVGDSLVGDVAFAEASARAAWITPVPGGVGPMTVAMLMHNAVAASERGCRP